MFDVYVCQHVLCLPCAQPSVTVCYNSSTTLAAGLSPLYTATSSHHKFLCVSCGIRKCMCAPVQHRRCEARAVFMCLCWQQKMLCQHVPAGELSTQHSTQSAHGHDAAWQSQCLPCVVLLTCMLCASNAYLAAHFTCCHLRQPVDIQLHTQQHQYCSDAAAVAESLAMSTGVLCDNSVDTYTASHLEAYETRSLPVGLLL